MKNYYLLIGTKSNIGLILMKIYKDTISLMGKPGYSRSETPVRIWYSIQVNNLEELLTKNKTDNSEKVNTN